MHRERHTIHRVNWLRAAVLGANDGLVSTASLIVGVAASAAALDEILIAGVAGLAAGAMSMAAGEYVSVSSQADSENADLLKEQKELIEQPELELNELTQIYVQRGLAPETASEVARQLTAHDALQTHLRDELGITEITAARPLQAAFVSAVTFSIGAILPVIVTAFSFSGFLIYEVVASTIVFLGLLGYVGAKIGGAPPLKATVRVIIWGALAMLMTAIIGYIFGVSV